MHHAFRFSEQLLDLLNRYPVIDTMASFIGAADMTACARSRTEKHVTLMPLLTRFPSPCGGQVSSELKGIFLRLNSKYRGKVHGYPVATGNSTS